MALRIVEADLRAILKCGATVDLTVFMNTANVLVDDLLGSSSLSANTLKLIETYLAAHLYALTEERGSLASETFGDSTERYHNVYKAGFNSTRFGQQALVIDTTGTLARESAKADKASIKSAEFRVL